MLYVRNGSLHIQLITKTTLGSIKCSSDKGLESTNIDLNRLHYMLHLLSLLFTGLFRRLCRLPVQQLAQTAT